SSCAIDSHIQTANTRDGPIHQITHIVFVADVTTDKTGLCSQRLQLRSQLLSFFISTTGHNHVCSVLRKGDCGSATDACQCDCDQNNLRDSSKASLHVRRLGSDLLTNSSLRPPLRILA